MKMCPVHYDNKLYLYILANSQSIAAAVGTGKAMGEGIVRTGSEKAAWYAHPF